MPLFWICLYACVEGSTHAGIFSHNDNDCNGRWKEHFNIHWFFNAMRAVVFPASAWSVPTWGGFFIAIACFWLVFHFLHNGFRYEVGRYLEPEKKELQKYHFAYSKSESTTAKTSFSFPIRAFMFVLGIVGYVFFV